MVNQPTWVGSPAEVLHGDLALEAIQKTNDSRYWEPGAGIIRVDRGRWERAQEFERSGWIEHWPYAQSDRNEEHARLFDNYATLPEHLGDMLEVGCGPFTQSLTILKGRTASQITLSDPLVQEYRSKHPNCSYKSGQLANFTTSLWPVMAENITIVSGYDTIVCINVLEHVMDSVRALSNIHHALKPMGIIIFGERSNDGFDPMKSYDVGHPIVLTSNILNGFKSKFNLFHDSDFYFIGRKR